VKKVYDHVLSYFHKLSNNLTSAYVSR